MYNGLWTVEFISTLQNRTGKGVLVISGAAAEGRLLGGDSAYYYSGHCKIDNNKFSGKIIIIRHDPTGISVFGDIDSFKLSFSGQLDKLHFSAAATIENNPQFKIRIVGNKKEDL